MSHAMRLHTFTWCVALCAVACPTSARGGARVLDITRRQQQRQNETDHESKGRAVGVAERKRGNGTRPARPEPFRLGVHEMPVRRKPDLNTRASSREKKVVIVGAGYAGWGASRRLVEGGMRARDVTLLEADSDFGGRTRRNVRFAPFPLDLGASFVHASFRAELADLAGVPSVDDLPLAEVDHQGWYLWKNRQTYYGFLADHLVSRRIVTEYDCKVTSVDYRRADAVETTCENGKSFLSTHVIIAVPLSVLKDEDIEFRPALPGKVQRNVNRRRWGGGFKIFLEFDTEFNPFEWICLPEEDDYYYYYDAPDDPYENCYDYDDEGVLVGEQLFWDQTRAAAPAFEGRRNLVAGYVTGTFAEEFEGMSERRLVDRVLAKFSNYYWWDGGYRRGYRPDSYLRHLLVDWSDPAEKPFVRGTYSARWPGFEGWRATGGGGGVFLAGEAFPAPLDDGSGGYEEPGWVYTALHSGQKAAEMVLELPSPRPARPPPTPRPTPRPRPTLALCRTQTACREQAKAMGFDVFYANNYSNINTYGCFSKKDTAYWGRGGTDEQRRGELSGVKQRIYCNGEPT